MKEQAMGSILYFLNEGVDESGFALHFLNEGVSDWGSAPHSPYDMNGEVFHFSLSQWRQKFHSSLSLSTNGRVKNGVSYRLILPWGSKDGAPIVHSTIDKEGPE